MKRRVLSVLLAVIMVVTSLDMMAYATEAEDVEAVWTQEEEFEAEDEAEQTTWIEEVETSETVKESKTVEATQVEVLSESVSEENFEQHTTLLQEEESVETKINEETKEVQERVVQSDNEYGIEEKTQEYESETEETEAIVVAASYERISRVTRDDGTWLYPLNKAYWNNFTDWAGCPGESKCSFCGTTHKNWGDTAHTGQSYGHNGFDIGVSIGTSVLAAASGTVAYTSTGNNGGRGNFIVIEHPISGTDFSYYSYYQHLNSISVAKGTSVKAGDTIAKSGNSGIGTGAHLHFGIVMAQKGTDYVLSYKNNNKTGSNAFIVIKGKGNFKGSITLPFTVATKSITSPDLTIRVPDVPYTGKANKYQSKPSIIDKDGKELTLNKDYTIENYRIGSSILDKQSNPENNMEITITIQGKGNYTGTATETYQIRGIKFSSAKIKVNAKSYTGKAVAIEPKDIISASIKTGKVNKPLVYGKDYEIVGYKNNIRKGTATVILKGKGDYAGEKAVKFKIKSSYITN